MFSILAEMVIFRTQRSVVVYVEVKRVNIFFFTMHGTLMYRGAK